MRVRRHDLVALLGGGLAHQLMFTVAPLRVSCPVASIVISAAFSWKLPELSSVTAPSASIFSVALPPSSLPMWWDIHA